MHPKFGGNSARKVLQRFHKDAVLILKAAETFINFTAVSIQLNFSHILNFKVASYSACYLTNGVYIRYLLEKHTSENKVRVIAVVKMQGPCMVLQFFMFYKKK